MRDPRESTRKCSLSPLRGLEGIEFVTYRRGRPVDGAGRILLHPEGEPLSALDAERGILLVDCAWRHLPGLLREVEGRPVRRRLPALRTAYPRRSRTFPDPDAGLASVEALYASLALLGRPRPELLRGYRWADAFLAANPELLR